MAAARSFILAVLVVAVASQSASAKIITVGGPNSVWALQTAAPTFYDDWAKTETFNVGDELLFVYEKSLHNVYEVSAADAASCTLNPIQTYTESNATVTLSKAGTHGFVCAIPNHCASGNMKLTLEVVGSTTPSASPSASPSATPSASPSATPSSAPSASSPKASSPSPTTAPKTVPSSAPEPAPSASDASNMQSRSAVVVGAIIAAGAALLL